MVFMFEDNPTTPSSELLCYTFPGKYYFSGGSDSVSDKVESILASNAEDVVVFFDVVLDNDATVDKYQMYRAMYRDNQRVHIIPIPCIEYYLCEWLHKAGILITTYYDKSKMTFLLKDIIDESFGFNPASLEKFYKSLMTKTKYHCTLNRIDQNKDYIGAYYRGDCNCQRHCSKKDGVSRKDKGLSLVYTLPAYPSTDDLPGQSVTVEGVKLLQRLLYNKMSSDLGLKMKLKI